jgi:hypothetical protein
MKDTYATAFKLLTLGFSVIPSGGGDKGKAPLVAWQNWQKGPPDESQLEQWQRELKPKLWGIVTNDRIAVIEADLGQLSERALAKERAISSKNPVGSRIKQKTDNGRKSLIPLNESLKE